MELQQMRKLRTPRQRLEALAEWLEGGAHHESITFNMEDGIARTRITSEPFNARNPAHSACTTSCCIAGAAVQFFDSPDAMFNRAYREWDIDREEYRDGKTVAIPWNTVKHEAAELLGLNYDDTAELFTPHEHYYSLDLNEFSDPAWAARTIRHYLDTGEMSWAATSEGDKREALVNGGYLYEEEEETA